MTSPADWQDFAEMIGTASGTLTGLLFVAVSLNARRIAEHRGLRASAAQTLVLFVIPLIVAVFLLAPEQPDGVIGGELIATGLAASWVLLSIARLKQGLADEDRMLIAVFDSRAANVSVMLLYVACGICLACRTDDGLYLLLPASLIAFVSGVLNAWRFLLPPSHEAKR
jgi:hypothetical protein